MSYLFLQAVRRYNQTPSNNFYISTVPYSNLHFGVIPDHQKYYHDEYLFGNREDVHRNS